jgi:hypothetical protein
MTTDASILVLIAGIMGSLALVDYYRSLSAWQAIGFLFGFSVLLVGALAVAREYFSKFARARKKRIGKILEIPASLITETPASVFLGNDQDLGVPVYLPDSVRSRHVHILGATGSGKTESVVLNFLKQDVARGLGSIILDAKGDASFLNQLQAWVPADRLQVFDLSSSDSLGYDPLSAGGPLEAAQRLFGSLQWSEEYYKSKAFTALQRIFETHHRQQEHNPTLAKLNEYLATEAAYASAMGSNDYPVKLAAKDFLELSGLRDQIKGLTIGYIGKILSPERGSGIQLTSAHTGTVIYFRLQSLLSQQLVSTVGRLVINHLSHLAGTAHRETAPKSGVKFLPTYLDEFASFACPEFADLISKARSAGLALHFSHQSIGDLTEISPGFLSRITDNSATKIVLRINDPDSAEIMARTFGTALYQKITQRITNVVEIESAEVVGEGTQREAHQFRAAPDLMKTLPTGMGSVLVAHGYETPHGASTVFRVRFPRLSDGKMYDKVESR